MLKLLDGSCGSALWAMAEKAGIENKPAWRYSIENPDLVIDLHRSYIDAGADMIQTNTFCVNRPSVTRSSNYSVEKLVKSAVELAREAAKETKTGIYLSCGPLDKLLAPYGNLSYEECGEIYDEIFLAAKEAGIEIVMLETFMDIKMIRIAAQSALKHDIQVSCSMTFEKRHRTMMGDRIKDICDVLSPMGILAIGMNCSFGPVEGIDVIREFREYTDLPLYFKPNAGVGEICYEPAQFAELVEPAIGIVSYIGGCCGTDASYISAIRTIIDKS